MHLLTHSYQSLTHSYQSLNHSPSLTHINQSLQTHSYIITVLSQLESLTGTIDAAGILIPVVSAVVFLVVGGYLALYVAPGVVEQYVLRKVEPEHHGKVELALMFAILLAMMPATHYAKASYLMGAFVAGLAFCTSHELHATFVQQFKRIMQWLMRIFFAASIGFQVPVKDFADGTVVWQGMVFTVALLGKLAVGFMVPNFTQSKHFTGLHLRDCLITGFSMAAEGEFAFVIAVFAVDNELIDKDLYASVVLAVLMSTIIPPFLLKFTIGYYNRKAHETVRKLANEEMELLHDLESEQAEPADLEGISKEEREAKLAGEIRNQRAVFLCIQTQSEASWGLLHLMMATVAKLGLDIIDHRSWHPRGINTTLVNEIYCKDKISVKGRGQAQAVLEERMLEIKEALEKTIKQPETSKTQVSRWFPGVVEEIVERVNHKEKVPGKKVLSLEQRLLREASTELDKKQNMQLHATHERSVEEILSGMQKAADLPAVEEGAAAPLKEARRTKRAPRHRQKMRSTPVVGGGLFGESKTEEEKHEEQHAHSKKPSGGALDSWKADFGPAARNGHKAEIIVNGESYDIRINDATMRALQAGFSGDMLDSRGVSIHGALSIEPDSSNVVSRLQGYVRSSPAMGMITEETVDGESETSSVSNINPV
jgi:hypothetical protein